MYNFYNTVSKSIKLKVNQIFFKTFHIQRVYKCMYILSQDSDAADESE